jgi:hypothetical protein
MGGLRGLDFKYGLNKPIEMNETDYYPLSYRGDKVADSRVEAWEFIVGGGAGFNQLNGLYTVENPGGKTPENEQLLTDLSNLKTFMDGFEFTKMRPDKGFVISGLPSGTYSRAISEPGRQYALYIHHSRRRVDSYEVVPGDYHEKLAIDLPAGSYRVEWVNPATGSVISSETIQGGRGTLTAPRYSVDIALRIHRRDAEDAQRQPTKN